MEETLKIQKLVVQIKVTTEDEAKKINDDINEYIKIYVLPEIERQLNTIDSQSSHRDLIIDKLNLTINSTDTILNSNLSTSIGTQFEKELKKVISKAAATKNSSNENKVIINNNSTDENPNPTVPFFLDETSKRITALLFFLKTGQQPWWSDTKTATAIFDTDVITTLVNNKESVDKITALIKSIIPQKRFLLQFTNAYKRTVYNAINKTNTATNPAISNKLLEQIEMLKFTDSHLLWTVLFRSFYDPKITKTASTNNQKFAQLVYNKINTKNKITTNPKQVKRKEEDILHTEKKEKDLLYNEEKETIDVFISEKISIASKETNNITETTNIDTILEGLILNHVGILLLHPFLKHFFKKLNLLTDDNQLTDNELAVHILHYVITGNTQAPECDMSFEKYLCNIPLTTPISRERIITNEHKKEVELLFQAVKSNWSTIARFSITMIQNEFLKRSGKLMDLDEGAKIVVERRGLDILMEKMDWGIGLIKLPWKEHFIYVNW